MKACVQPAGRNSATVHPVLENTSLAEFLRVLQSVQRQGGAMPTAPAAPLTPGKTRKLGTAGLGLGHPQPAPNSIFNLFPGLLDNNQPEERRLSLRPSSPPGLLLGQPGQAQSSSKRRMSFWPSFGSDSAGGDPSGGPSGPRRKSSAARRLSSLFGGGTCTDPDPDHAADVYTASGDVPTKGSKKRRFSIWPTLSVIGRGGDKEEEKPVGGLGSVEDGRGDGLPGLPGLPCGTPSPPPQITISYVSDVPPPPPPPPAPREALRRMALTSNLVTSSVPAASGAGPLASPLGVGQPTLPIGQEPGARMCFPRTSLSGVPLIPAERGRRPSHLPPSPSVSPLASPLATPLASRRGPSFPSPLSTPAAAIFRRRALSESTRTRQERHDPNQAANGSDSQRL